MDLSERIEKLLDYAGMRQATFAKHIGATKQQIQDLKSGKTKSLSDSMRSKIISSFPTIDLEWLLTGEGDMLVEGNVAADVPIPSDGNFRMVPIVHIDSVGGIHSLNSTHEPPFIEGYIPLTDARDGDLAIYQSGDSMSPAIPAGALLQIREVEEWQDYIGYGNVFVLLLNDLRRITKEINRYDPDPRNYYWCVSYNPNVADEELPKRMVRRVWKVIKVLIDKGW